MNDMQNNEIEEKKAKSSKAITIYLIFFFIMIAYIAIAPFVAIDKVEKRTKLSPKERISR